MISKLIGKLFVKRSKMIHIYIHVVLLKVDLLQQFLPE